MRLKSPDPRAAPEIKLNYLSTREDQKVAVDSLRLTRRIITTTETMKKYHPEEFLKQPVYSRDFPPCKSC